METETETRTGTATGEREGVTEEAAPVESEVEPAAGDLETEPRVAQMHAVASTESARLERERREPAPRERIRSILESLLFVSDRPVTPRELSRALRTEEKRVREALDQIRTGMEGRGIVLAEVAGGFQLRSSPENSSWVQSYLQARPVRLSRAALETLAIIAYRQPLTRPEVDDLRGVDSGGVMKLLLERGLVKILGKKDEPGRPLLYGTTSAFLELFGLKSLRDLPTLRQFTELSEEHQAILDRHDSGDAGSPKPDEPSRTRDTEPQSTLLETQDEGGSDSELASDLDEEA